jgi:hypothetical protein
VLLGGDGHDPAPPVGGVLATVQDVLPVQVAPDITPSLREAAYRHPQVPDAPARLIAAITDAVAGVLGEEVR